MPLIQAAQSGRWGGSRPATESQKQASRQWVLQHRPWERSTGPRSPQGKQRSSRNRAGKYNPALVRIAAIKALLRAAQLEQRLGGAIDRESQDDLLLAKSVLHEVIDEGSAVDADPLLQLEGAIGSEILF